MNTRLLIQLLLLSFVFSCSGNSNSNEQLYNAILSTNKDIINKVDYRDFTLYKTHLFIDDIIKDLNPSKTFPDVSNVCFIAFNKDIIPKTLDKYDYQIIALDSINKSISVSFDSTNFVIYDQKSILVQPEAIAALSNGTIFVSDMSNDCIYTFKYNGYSLLFTTVLIRNIKAIDLLINNSNLYILDKSKNQIIRIKDIEHIYQEIDDKSISIDDTLNSFSYEYKNIKFTGVRAFDIDKNGNIALVQEYGKKLLFLDFKGNVNSIKFISLQNFIEDIAISNYAVYLLSKAENKIFVLRSDSLNNIGFIKPDTGDYYEYLNNVQRIFTISEYGILYILDKKKHGIFRESPYFKFAEQ